jgi:hypothetical protein
VKLPDGVVRLGDSSIAVAVRARAGKLHRAAQRVSPDREVGRVYDAVVVVVAGEDLRRRRVVLLVSSVSRI